MSINCTKVRFGGSLSSCTIFFCRRITGLVRILQTFFPNWRHGTIRGLCKIHNAFWAWLYFKKKENLLSVESSDWRLSETSARPFPQSVESCTEIQTKTQTSACGGYIMMWGCLDLPKNTRTQAPSNLSKVLGKTLCSLQTGAGIINFSKTSNFTVRLI